MSNDMARIVDVIKNNSTNMLKSLGGNIEFGLVISIDPIKIQIDQRKIIDGESLILSPFCLRAEFDNYMTTYERGGGSGYPAFESHDHNFHVGLWRELKIGDSIIMFVSNDKQTYVGLWRKDMQVGDMG